MTPPTASSSRMRRHQVFLSFRGTDTRHKFTCHLLEALKNSGVNVFFDEEKLEKGKEVASALSTAIVASNISVIILSEDYASSNSCLDELSDIMNLKKTKGHIVRPIFYHVDPSDVKNVDGSFKTSFREHGVNRPDKVERWKTAFIEVGKLGGCVIKGGNDERPETEYISDVVDSVTLALKKHQVFLSFGEKMRLNFANHLHKALERRGVNVVINNETLNEKSQPIAGSDISIIILSDDYASSESCLAEVSEIMEHRKTQEQIVLPIFYQVKPAYVRSICGSFKSDFDRHESEGKHRVQLWKSAFVEVGNVKGWHIEGLNCDRSETEYIKDITEDIIKKLKSKSRSVSEGKFGIYYKKEEILRLVEKEETRVIGLWGPGGIGKTTLAEAVYNEISPYFEARWFVQNVREKIEKQGMELLRNELLSKLLNSEIRIDTPSVGSSVIKDRLENTKALVVLDDVIDFHHIADLGIDYFGDGSKIIVTSRERQALDNAGADEIHEVEGLSDQCSFQLFSAAAFKQSKPNAEFLKLSSEFLSYAQGSPLALKVLGSLLCNKPVQMWKGEAAKLREYGKPQILQVLERSYRGLDELEKKIFLDIAIFFKAEPKEDAEAFLSSCYGDGGLSGISSLVDKCLLEILTFHPFMGEPYECFYMHDMLEEMGKHIESNYRRRLWRPEEVNRVLKNNEGVNSIEGIKSDIDHSGTHPTAFQSTSNLRFIDLRSWSPPRMPRADAVDIESLPGELRYLYWRKYPFMSLSSNFSPVNLVTLRLSRGKMKRLWNGDQVPVNLRVLDVSFCQELEQIPNLSAATKLKIIDCTFCIRLFKCAGLEHLSSLEKLIFSSCHHLWKIPSLSGAMNLKTLDCSYCSRLDDLPSLEHLTSLEKLIFSSCHSLWKISSLSGATKLKTLDCFSCTRLLELPSLKDLTSLEKLNFSSCKRLEKIPSLSGATNLKILDCNCCSSLVELPLLNHLTSLQKLGLYKCESLKKFPEVPSNISKLNLSKTGIEEVSDSIEHLIRLKSLKMSRSKVKRVSSNVSKLESLQVLRMHYCRKLEILPQLPPNLVQLDAHNCKSLTEVSFTDGDPNLHLIRDTDEIFYIFSRCSFLKAESVNNILENVIHKIKYLAQGIFRGQLICCLPGKEISADKFEFWNESSSLQFEIDKTLCSPSEILAFAICLVVDLTCFHHFKGLRVVCEYRLTALTAVGRDKYGWHTYGLDNMSGRKYRRDHMLILFGDKLIFKGKYKKASFTFYFVNHDYKVESSGIKVKKCGVHVFPVDLGEFHVPFSDSDEKSSDEYQDARSEEVHEDSATEEDLASEETNISSDIRTLFSDSDEMSSDEYQEDASSEEAHEDSATEEDLAFEEIYSTSSGIRIPFSNSNEISIDEYQDARSEEVHKDIATEEDLASEETYISSFIRMLFFR